MELPCSDQAISHSASLTAVERLFRTAVKMSDQRQNIKITNDYQMQRINYVYMNILHMHYI